MIFKTFVKYVNRNFWGLLVLLAGWCSAVIGDASEQARRFSDLLLENGPDYCPYTGMDEAIPTGHTEFSPNKRFSLQLIKIDREAFFFITDHRSGDVIRIPNEFAPTLAIDWSPDSQNVVTIGHASMTSLIVLLHWTGKEWQHFQIDDPLSGTDSKFHVINWKFKPGQIVATYIVNLRTGRDADDLYRCTFNVDVATGTISHTKKAHISLGEYRLLRTSEN